MILRLIDSVILIDHLNNVKKGSDFLAGLDPRETAISVITRAEILCGVDDAGFEETGMLLDQYVLLTLDRAAPDAAARLRKEYGWKLRCISGGPIPIAPHEAVHSQHERFQPQKIPLCRSSLYALAWPVGIQLVSKTLRATASQGMTPMVSQRLNQSNLWNR